MNGARFHKLVTDMVACLQIAAGDREKIESSIRTYLVRGQKLGASPDDLWDYFAISSPGIPEKAGYCGVECEEIVTVFERLFNERFGA